MTLIRSCGSPPRLSAIADTSAWSSLIHRARRVLYSAQEARCLTQTGELVTIASTPSGQQSASCLQHCWILNGTLGPVRKLATRTLFHLNLVALLFVLVEQCIRNLVLQLLGDGCCTFPPALDSYRDYC